MSVTPKRGSESTGKSALPVRVSAALLVALSVAIAKGFTGEAAVTRGSEGNERVGFDGSAAAGFKNGLKEAAISFSFVKADDEDDEACEPLTLKDVLKPIGGFGTLRSLSTVFFVSNVGGETKAVAN